MGTINWTSLDFNKLYGPGMFLCSALANTRVGNGNLQVSFRFRATQDSYISSARFYWQAGTGYGGGNGGTLQINIYPDAGGVPNLNAAPLAQCTYRPHLDVGNGSRNIFDELYFHEQRENLVRGRLYHIVQRNLDGNEGANFISSNNVASPLGNPDPSNWLAPDDFATLFRAGNGNWQQLTLGDAVKRWRPILQLTYANGHGQGNGCMEGGFIEGRFIFTAGPGKVFRQVFQPSQQRVITGISIAACPTAAGQSYMLRIRGPQYNILYQRQGVCNVAYSTYPQGAHQIGRQEWLNQTFRDSPVTFNKGETYFVEFTPVSGTWKIGSILNGTQYGFTYPAAHSESWGEHEVDGKFIGINYRSQNADGGKGAALPLMLHLQ